MMNVNSLPLIDGNCKAVRIISTRYPQISLFERVANSEDYDLLYAIESLTNNRLRDECGDIALVPREDRLFGPGSSWIMAPFTHPPAPDNGGRFNRDFGVFYCALKEAVAVAETKYHTARFYRDSRIKQITVQMRALKVQLGFITLRDATGIEDAGLYHPDNYDVGQQLGAALRGAREYGIRYRSVRGKGDCIGLFRPNGVAAIAHSRYLNYHFKDGKITRVTKGEA